jgi:hypothetical protein
MATQEQIEILRKAILVNKHLGSGGRRNVASYDDNVYEDGKIEIRNSDSSNDKDDPRITIYVGSHSSRNRELVFSGESNNHAFAVPDRKPSVGTCRPGKWVDHLDSLYQKAVRVEQQQNQAAADYRRRKDAEDAIKRDNSFAPIDDSDIFD